MKTLSIAVRVFYFHLNHNDPDLSGNEVNNY